MNRTKAVFIVSMLLTVVIILGWSLIGKSRQSLGPSINNAPLPLPAQQALTTDQASLVEYQVSPQDPYFHGPCPIDSAILNDIRQRTLPIGFENEKGTRQWESISKNLEEKRSIDSFKKNLRDFLLVLIKLQHPQSYRLMGNSEGGDMIAYARVAICDEIAIAHHHIKGGIDPSIGQDYCENNNLVPSKQDRILFETFYRSCRLTASNAFRFGPVLLTRSAFYPSKQDLSLILKALDLDPKRPNEAVCTYKNR